MSYVWLACAVAMFGHNPDTSYARIEVRRDKIETRLTYDVFTLLSIVPLDDNRDGQVSKEELTRHLPKIAEFLDRRIDLAVNGDEEDLTLGRLEGFVWPPEAKEAIPEADYHSQNGLIHLRFVRDAAKRPESVRIWFDFFETFGERHTVLGSFTAQGDDLEVLFTRFEPEFEYVPPGRLKAEPEQSPSGPEGGQALSSAPPAAAPPVRRPATWRSIRQFFLLGVEHIFLGYDHICFLIALIVVSKFRELVKIITSFTIAHSITLILATFDVVRLPSRLVETCIAATIVYVAIENLWVKETKHRWWLTFLFGLVHGLGFANVLREMSLPTTGLVRCLISFNVGVECGQLLIAGVLFPLALAVQRFHHGRPVMMAISVTLALFGAAWFIDRALALEWMPF
jgi:hydrogenase/urease accessory protein HupE